MLLSDNTLIRIIINHYFDCQFPFYANKSPLHLTHWTFNVEKKSQHMTCACFPAVGCIFSLSRRYLLSAQTDTVYAWGEKHLGSNPGAAERRRNVPAAPGRAGDFTHKCVQQRTEKAQPGRHVEMWASNGGFAPCKHYITLGRHETSVRFKIYILE